MPLRNVVDFAVEWMARYRKVDPDLMSVDDLCKF